jgi:hypothetical protein
LDWDCPRGETDQLKLIRWTKKQLKAQDDAFLEWQRQELECEVLRENWAEANGWWDYFVPPEFAVTAGAAERWWRQRAPVGEAIKKRDVAALMRLTVGNRELLEYAFQLLIEPPIVPIKRPRGAPSGHRFTPEQWDRLVQAVSVWERIPPIWKEEFGLQNRHNTKPPTAAQIAAKYCGDVPEAQLRYFRKNYPLYSD